MYGAAAFAEQRVGTTFNGKYRLEQLLGVGGMAAVYRGTHRNGNRVAVKVLHPDISIHSELRERFQREGYVANKVDHRGAVRVLDDDTAQDGSVFLVMELLEGETLDARWMRAGRRLPHREVAEWTHELLDVLAAAHDKGIVHRDVKPENLFLTRDGILKVLDFGIARLRDPSNVGMVSMTRTGNMLGTPAYMPPEQMLGRAREIDGQTDVWAVGATMFTLISGQYVHDADTIQEMVVYAGSRPARSIASVASETPPALASVIDRALAFEKGTRWPSARGMQEALQTARAACYETARLGGEPADASVNSAIGPAFDDRTRVLDSDPASSRTTLPMAAPRTAAPRASALPAPSASTTGGVESRGGRGLGVRRSRQLRTAILGISVALVLGAVGTVVALRQEGGSTVASGSPTTPAQPASVVIEKPKLPTAATSSPGPTSLVEPAVVSGSAPTTAVDAAATQVSRTSRPWAAPARPSAEASAGGANNERALERVLSGLRPAPRSATAATTTAATRPNCQPPYTVDSEGRRIPKPECL